MFVSSLTFDMDLTYHRWILFRWRRNYVSAYNEWTFFVVLQVGLVSDEKLVDLLDLALSADTANTVKNLRDIMESGVEPLALMSQLATAITDILAGSYDVTKEGPQRRFFRRRECNFSQLHAYRYQ